jgi:hypothetical protein
MDMSNQHSETRGKAEASDYAWEKFYASYMPMFKVEYHVYYYGKVFKKTQTFSRDMVYGIIARNTGKLQLPLPEKVWPELKDSLSRKIYKTFTTTPYDGWEKSKDVIEVTYIVSDVSQAYRAMGMTTPEMATLMKQLMPFIEGRDKRKGKLISYLDYITELDHFACPQCAKNRAKAEAKGEDYRVNIMHISEDKCSTCDWVNPQAVHHVNREIYGEYLGSTTSTSVNIARACNLYDLTLEYELPLSVRRKGNAWYFHQKCKPQKLNVIEHDIDYQFMPMEEFELATKKKEPRKNKAKYVAKDKPVHKYPRPDWLNEENNQPLNSPYWVNLRANEMCVAHAEKFYAEVKTLFIVKGEK